MSGLRVKSGPKYSKYSVSERPLHQNIEKKLRTSKLLSSLSFGTLQVRRDDYNDDDDDDDLVFYISFNIVEVMAMMKGYNERLCAVKQS